MSIWRRYRRGELTKLQESIFAVYRVLAEGFIMFGVVAVVGVFIGWPPLTIYMVMAAVTFLAIGLVMLPRAIREWKGK